MPGLSGPEVVRRLGTVRPNLKIIFCSGYTSSAIQHAEALGSGRAFLQKPFTPGALARKVREVLDAA
jgi:two-component system cell cycle sensor histidine kinase/response regulator CckA